MSQAIKDFQQQLKDAGFDPGPIDGESGPKTRAAWDAYQASLHPTTQATTDPSAFTIDSRSQACINTLVPKVQVLAKQWYKLCYDQNKPVVIVSGTRTYAEQDVLFAERPKVTNAPGGYSNHNFGIAWDFGVLINGKLDLNASAKIKECALIGESIGLEWGGRWDSFPDENHLQFKTSLSLADMRKLHAEGKDVV